MLALILDALRDTVVPMVNSSPDMLMLGLKEDMEVYRVPVGPSAGFEK